MAVVHVYRSFSPQSVEHALVPGRRIYPNVLSANDSMRPWST